MTSLSVVVFLAAVLFSSFPANGQHSGFADLSTTLTQVQREIVDKHNELRRAVSPEASDMLKMGWDNEAAKNAQNWANKCIYEHSDKKDRRTNTSCGENLFMSSAPTSWSYGIQSWYDESSDFVYGAGPTSPNAVIGHYTQVVWSTSFRVGCGIAYCPNQGVLKYFYVCQYCPAGNYINRQYFPYKKGPPCSSCPGYCDKGLCTNSCGYEDAYSNCPDLKKMFTCTHALVRNNCKASCNCEGKIY
nr:cysteine-rich secretory protein 3-like [Loxodonta africana]